MLKSRKFLYPVLVLAGIFIAAAGTVYRYLNQPTDFGNQPVHVVVEPGMSLTRLSLLLSEKRIISHPKVWTLYARLARQTGHIKTGEYLVSPNSSPLALLNQFTSGDVIQYQITFIEGWDFKQILKELGLAEKLEHQVHTSTKEEIMARLNQPGKHPEGLFFPDSYNYVLGTTDLEILKRANSNLETILQQEWQNRQEGLPYETPYEALIMASIIEKETGAAEEREEIAGVFIRRLEKGMRLQTDPTVIYGLGDKYRGNLTRKHLRQASPYNTYLNKGLPPTPIAMVGRAAIHAALHPKAGTSLYFVAKGDGSHFFSDTLDEHINAVRKYQLKKRTDYRSSPSKPE